MKRVLLLTVMLVSVLALGYSQNANVFPTDFLVEWKRDDFDNTLTFRTNNVKESNNYLNFPLYRVSGDIYNIGSYISSSVKYLTIKLVNGNLEISGDSGSGEENWNGTWKKVILTEAQPNQQLQNGIFVTGRIPSRNSDFWFRVIPTVNSYVAITLEPSNAIFDLEIYDEQNNLLLKKKDEKNIGEKFNVYFPAEASKTYKVRLIAVELGRYSDGNNYRIITAIEGFDSNPTPNSGDDFDIIQNAQGGITITGYRSSRRQVVIPSTISGIKITEIAKNVFNGKKLYSVIIPDSVTSIGQFAFNNNNLTSITIPNSVRTIGSGAFSNNNLTSVIIPNSVRTIGSSAFSNNNLTSVTIPNVLTEIDSGTFSNNKLTSVTIPNSVTTIGWEAFSGNALTSVTFGSRVETIGNGAFANNKLTELTNLPASVSYIGTGAFYNNSITTVTLPGNSNLALISGSAISGNYFDKPVFANNPIKTLIVPAALIQTTTRSVDYVRSSNISRALGNSLGTLITITMPANAPMGESHLISGLPNNFALYYESQNRKAGTYSWDGRLWSVR